MEWTPEAKQVLRECLARIACVTFHYGVKPLLNIPMAGRVGELMDYDDNSPLPYILKFTDPVEGEHTFGYSDAELDELHDKVYPY